MRDRLLRPAKDSRYALLAHEPLEILWAHPAGRECRRPRGYGMSGRRSWGGGEVRGGDRLRARAASPRTAAPPPPGARAPHHLEVHIRRAPMSVASRADGANHLAADETGVLRKPVTIRIQMGVVVDEMFALIGCIYREPTLAVPLQSEHTPIVSGQDRCSVGCGDVDGGVETGSAARGSKVVGYVIWRHARHGHHELPRAERTVEGRLASWEERAPRDLKCNERQRAPSAPSPVHLTAAFASASVRAPRRFGYHSHFASAGGVGFAGAFSISGGSRSPFWNSRIAFPRLPIIWTEDQQDAH